LPVAVASAVFLAHNYRQQRNVLLGESLASARALMGAVDREFASAGLALHVLATSPSLERVDLINFQAQAEQVIGDSFIHSIVLLASDGRQLMNTSVRQGLPLPEVQALAQVRQVMETGLPAISNLAVGADIKLPLASIAVPVPGKQLVLLAIIRPVHVHKVVMNFGLAADRVTAVFDRQGIIVARSHDFERTVGKNVSPIVFKEIQNHAEGTIEAVTIEGLPVIGVFRRSSTTGWGTVIGVPAATLTANLRQSMWILAGFFVALLSLSLLLARVMGGRIAHAVRALRLPAMALADNKPVAVPRLGICEADEVGEAITRVSLALVDANDALKASDMRMRSILQSAMDAIVTLDDEQVIVIFNAAAASMFGCSGDEAIGLPVTRFIPKRFHAQHFEYVSLQSARKQPASYNNAPNEATGLRRNGEEFPVEVSYSRTAESGNVFHTLIIRDITSRVEAFNALKRSNQDLQQFAYVASHDLKTPLRSISGFVQVLERNYADKLDDKALSLIHRTVQAANRLEQLTDDLLAYAKVSSEAKPFTELNCNELAVELCNLMDASIRQSGAVLTFANLPKVMGDRTQLIQLFMNLVGNGIKYCCDRQPAVRVSAEQKDSFWVFSIADNGIGIDNKHFEKIFAVFTRLHTQKDYVGTGIGLAVCRRVVESHGGSIWLESEVDRGSTFYFTLPAIPTEGPDHA